MPKTNIISNYLLQQIIVREKKWSIINQIIGKEENNYDKILERCTNLDELNEFLANPLQQTNIINDTNFNVYKKLKDENKS